MWEKWGFASGRKNGKTDKVVRISREEMGLIVYMRVYITFAGIVEGLGLEN